MLKTFQEIGGNFVTFPDEIRQKLQNIKAFVSDWDGVFNTGMKGENISSYFTEADSMGTNLLRYFLWEKNQEMPITAIITGANNPSARKWAEREHLQVLYSRIADKKQAILHLCEQENIEPKNVMYCFDDVNDLPVAKMVGLRFLIRRNASPLFKRFVDENKLADYITGQDGGHHAIREVCELLLGLSGQYGNIVQERVNFSENYQAYFTERQTISTKFLTMEDISA